MPASNASSHLAATFAANLRIARKARGMTQAQLADAIGLSDFMTVSRWERGIHRPSYENLIALSDHLGIAVGSLYEQEAAA